MAAEKPKTTDEYVLAELEKYKTLSNKLKKTNEELEAELAKKLPPTPSVVPTPFICFGYKIINPYDYRDLDNPLNSKQIQELLDNDTTLRAWAACATYKASYGSRRVPVLEVREAPYHYQINHYGTLLIGVYVYQYTDGTYSSNNYHIDEKQYFKNRDDAKEAGIQALRESLQERLEVVLSEEAAAAQAVENTEAE